MSTNNQQPNTGQNRVQNPVQTPESLEYRAEVKQLLNILAHSLYTEREIFLRELISNASDALNRVQFELLTNQNVLDANAELAIHLQIDTEAKTLTLSDSGIGMNRAELIENLGTIAHSGAKNFLQQASENKSTVEEIIGQFGVGFYSVFMVADEVTVTSRSYRPEDEAWTWRSNGDSQFTLTPAEKGTRGSEIVIKLKEDASEFANSWRIEQIIKKHSDYVSFPIYVPGTSTGKEGEVSEPKIANRRTALWRQTPSKVQAVEYAEFYQQLTYDMQKPLLHIHLVADAPVNVRAVLFVPSKLERGMLRMRDDHGLKLYSRKVLIQERNKELLPEYLRFVEGVVDSEDLPLSVSRETVQSNVIMRNLRKALTNRLFKELKSLAESEEAEKQEKYLAFWREFGQFLKEGVASDYTSHESLVDLLRFHSTKSSDDALISLKQYKARMADGQKAIYYVLGEEMQAVQRSPHLDYFRANGLEVLLLTDPIDGFMTTSLREVDGTPLQNVDDAGLELPEQAQEKPDEAQSTVGQDEFDRLLVRFRSVLEDKITGVRVSKTLVSSPCRLVSPEDSHERDLQRIRRMTEQNYEIPKKLLEVNRNHPLLANLATLLAKNSETTLVDATIEQLFANALLLEGIHPNPAEMVERVQKLMEAATRGG